MSLSIKSVPATPITEPVYPQTIEGLIGELENNLKSYSSHFCLYQHFEKDFYFSAPNINNVKQYANQLFGYLRESAKKGETSTTIEIGPLSSKENACSNVSSFAVVAELFSKKVLEKVSWEKKNNRHSTYCQLLKGPVTLTLSWSADNPYLNPKPIVSMKQIEAWGVNRLNQERLSKSTTDFTIVIGELKFPVHRLIISSFSPYFTNLLSGNYQEGNKSEIKIENTANLSKEALEAVFSFMYTGDINFDLLGNLVTIQLLEWSFYLLAENLGTAAFNHLLQKAELLQDQEILELLFVNSHYSYQELNQLCDWLVKAQPQFSDYFFKQNEMSDEALLKLLDVAKHYQLKELQDRVEKQWDDLTLDDKTTLVYKALENGSEGLLKKWTNFAREL
jgi:hypothetical protein